MKVVALMPMKANSERVKGKNFRDLGGKPLFRWMLDTLLSIKEVDTIVINTDAHEILEHNQLSSNKRIILRDRKPCERAVYSSIGTPLTHERFLRRPEGTYGSAWKAGEKTFPGHASPVDGLYCCGDSTFPGIGVPAVCGSGMAVAHAIVPASKHLKLLDEMRRAGTLA